MHYQDISKMKDKVVAFISSYDEICGNATYVKQLMEEITPYVKRVDIIKLDQFLIHSSKGCFDNIVIKDVIAKIKDYDYINVQWEPGLFASSQKKAYKFILKILKHFHGKAISLTLHSLNFNPSSLRLKKRIMLKIKYRTSRLFSKKVDSSAYYSDLFISEINKLVNKKNITFLVHSKELEKTISACTKVPVFCHPIVSATSRDLTFYKEPNAREKIINRYKLDPNKKYVGIFGFGGFYKGFDVMIKAMKFLPDDYHLIISSNIHPTHNNKRRKIDFKINNYIKSKQIPNPVEQNDYAFYLDKVIKNEDLNYSVLPRMHYINQIIDEEQFKELIAGVDIIVVPYYEVGQEGSGPLSYATFLSHSGKIIISRTGLFERYSRNFFPNCFTFFDQGNEIELAKKIQSVESKSEILLDSIKNYNPKTNIETYLASLAYSR